MVRWNRLGCPWPLSRKLATPVPRSSSTMGCCRNVGGGWLPCRRKGRPAGAGLGFSLAISVSVSDFPVSFDFSVCILELSLALARRAFLFSLRRRCKKSLPSEVSISTFTSSSSVLFLILFGVLVRLVQIGPVSYKIIIVHWQNARVVTWTSVGPHGTDFCYGPTPTFKLHLLSLQLNFKVFIFVPTT